MRVISFSFKMANRILLNFKTAFPVKYQRAFFLVSMSWPAYGHSKSKVQKKGGSNAIIFFGFSWHFAEGSAHTGYDFLVDASGHGTC